MRYVFCLLVLGACSSGGGAGVDVTRDEPIVRITPDPDVTLSGSARYDGGIDLQFFQPSTGDSVVLDGDLQLTVDFDNMDAAITGTATGFQGASGDYTGNLIVNTGGLDDSSGGLDFVTNINGSLLNGTTNYLVIGQMRGEVLGDAQQAASGQVSGQVQERGQPAPLAGQFQVARQP